MTAEPMTTRHLPLGHEFELPSGRPDSDECATCGRTDAAHDAPQPTPSLAEYRRLDAEDDNTFWRLESGDHQNLLEEALEEIDRLRAENARLAAQGRASGPETPQGHPSEGTGAPGAHARSEAHIDTIARILVGTDWDEEVRYTDIGSRETVEQISGRISTAMAIAYYQQAARSLRALGHDTAADLLDSTARDLTEGDTDG